MRDSVKTSQIEAADRAAMDEHVARIASSGDEQREPDFVDMLLTLSRRKKTILQVTIAAAVLALIVSLLLPKMYTATATILPPEQKQSSANLLLGQIGLLGGLAGGDLGLKNPDDLFVAMLKSRTVEDGIIDQFDLRKVY